MSRTHITVRSLSYILFSSFQQAARVKFESAEARLATINTKKAIYCALVLEEFVKELAALSQEHAVQSDEGYQTE